MFLLLVGIVFFNVDLLRMNRDIAATAQKAETIKRENARLRGDLARLGSSERIQTAAAQRGLVLPAAGEVRYLKANPGADGRNALARLKAGSGTATADPVPPAQAEPGETPRSRPRPTTPADDHAADDHAADRPRPRRRRSRSRPRSSKGRGSRSCGRPCSTAGSASSSPSSSCFWAWPGCAPSGWAP